MNASELFMEHFINEKVIHVISAWYGIYEISNSFKTSFPS